MPNFGTKVNEWDGAYAPPRTVTAKEDESGWGALASKLLPGALEAAGRGYAQAKGSNVQGLETSAVEAQAAVDSFDQAVPFTDDPSNTPDQRAEIEDMRTAALKKFATNDKKIQALVTAGKISSLEANARRHAILQDNLSNPILAMFKEDFLDASKPFTGGSGKLAEQYFGAFMPTEEERAKLAAVDIAIEEQAKHKAAVAGLVRMGMTEVAAEENIRAEQALAAKVAAAETAHKMRTYGSADAYMAGQDVVQLMRNQMGGSVAQLVMSSKTLTPQQIAQVPGQLDLAKNEFIKKLEPYKSQLTPTDYKALITEMNETVEAYTKMLSDKDGQEFAKKSMEQYLLGERVNEARASANFRNMIGADIYSMYKETPELAKMLMEAASGNVGAQYKVSNNILAKGLASKMGISLDGELLPGTVKKIQAGRTDFTTAEGLTLLSVLASKGAGGVVGQVELAQKFPDQHKALLQSVYRQPDAELDVYRSRDWDIAGKTPEGAKTLAVVLQEKMAVARTAQVAAGKDIPTTNILMKQGEVDVDVAGQVQQGAPTYYFNVDLAPGVQKALVDSYMIIKDQPLVMKELGVKTPEEFITNYFNASQFGKK